MFKCALPQKRFGYVQSDMSTHSCKFELEYRVMHRNFNAYVSI